jgi:hypothetical protein
MLKLFAFAFKFTAKKLGGAVERLMDYSICRLLYVVFVCVSLYHTIPWINYLFQNGRLLLTCIVLLSPTIGNPDVFDITRSPALYQLITPVSCPLWTDISRRSSYFSSLLLIAFRIRATCVVVEVHSNRSVSPLTPHFRNFSRKFDRFDVFNTTVRFV